MSFDLVVADAPIVHATPRRWPKGWQPVTDEDREAAFDPASLSDEEWQVLEAFTDDDDDDD